MSDTETVYDAIVDAQAHLDKLGIPWEVSSSRQHHEVTFLATRRGTIPRTVCHPHAGQLVGLVMQVEASLNPHSTATVEGLANERSA